MKVSLRYFIVLCISIATLSGCSGGSSNPDPDPEPVVTDQSVPTIIITKPTANQTFTAGSTIDFSAKFEDDLKLASYTVTISKLTTSSMVLKNVPTSTPFAYSKAENITGDVKTYTLPLDITIPANTTTVITTPGDYTVTVTCKDAAGKDAISKSVVIKIS